MKWFFIVIHFLLFYTCVSDGASKGLDENASGTQSFATQLPTLYPNILDDFPELADEAFLTQGLESLILTTINCFKNTWHCQSSAEEDAMWTAIKSVIRQILSPHPEPMMDNDGDTGNPFENID